MSASQVSEGRPYPYMVHRLMEQTGVIDVSEVRSFIPPEGEQHPSV